MTEIEKALVEWSEARKGALPFKTDAWERLARAEGALQLLADKVEDET